MAKIAVDIDDTLYSFGSVAKDALFRLAEEHDDRGLRSAAYTPSTQWRIPHDVAGGDMWMKAIELSHRPEVIAAQEPYSGSVETITALRDEGHEIIYISNRDEKASEPTYEWLENRGFPIGKHSQSAHLKCLWGDKIPHLRDCQYIIDDRPSTLIRFVFDFDWHDQNPDTERKGFSLHTPYNENLTDIENIYLAPSWAGLNYYLVEKGLLSEPAYEALGLLGEDLG